MDWLTALIIWYAIPFTAMFIVNWWTTSIWSGSPSAYWNERLNLIHIGTCVIIAAIWPVAIPALVKRSTAYLRYAQYTVHLRESRDYWLDKGTQK